MDGHAPPRVDIGSSTIKAAVLDAETGTIQASARVPSDEEMTVEAPRPGWAEQPPEHWGKHVQDATAALRDEAEFDPEAIRGLGLSYQMHGVVLVGEDHEVLRPAIIWADSRAVDIGRDAFEGLDVVRYHHTQAEAGRRLRGGPQPLASHSPPSTQRSFRS